MNKNLLDGLDAAQRAEVAQTLRGMRVLHDDRGIAATLQQEAETMGAGLKRLQDHDPALAKEVREAMVATFAARSQIEAEVTADSYARVAAPSRLAVAAFLQTTRQAHAGDGSALASLERARDELREAEAERGTEPDPSLRRDPSTLPAFELVAFMADTKVSKLLTSGAAAPEVLAAKGVRKDAEFQASQALLRDVQSDQEHHSEADKATGAAQRRSPEPENEVEAVGDGSRIKINLAALPDHFAEKYEKKGNALVRIGDSPDKALLRDHGAKLTTGKQYDSEAIKAMVDIAEVRGWNSLTVTGTEDFRRAVWNEAASRGLSVKGYKPTEAEQARIDKRLARNGKQNALSENESVKAFREAQTPHQRKHAITKHPELKAAFAIDAAAQAFARERLQGKSQKVFMTRMHNNIAFDIAQGRDMAAIRLLDPTSKDQNTFIRAQPPHHDAGRER